MNLITHLLTLYIAVVLMNTALSAALFRKSRTTLNRALLWLWASTLFSFFCQAALSEGAFLITLGFSSCFLVNLSLAHIVASSLSAPLRVRRWVLLLVASLAVSFVVDVVGGSFLAVSLPVAIAVAAPAFVTALRSAKARWRSLTISTRALLVSSVLFSAHNVDFAFLRDREDLGALGFTLAILIIFALSITATSVVLEHVAAQESRASAELDVARRIQTRILPGDATHENLEVACYMRSADSVGGDYYDVLRSGQYTWLLLGDVTGHGLGAGLVMLMAQSTISSILETRPDITPRELNYLANRVLTRNLKRLDERRHMTIVSIRRSDDDEVFVLSGSHDDIYVYRHETGVVESVAVSHFPFGLGFLGELTRDDFREETIRLGPGDTLFIGTDGITEAARAGRHDQGMFGSDLLVSFLQERGRAPVADIKRELLEKLDGFTGGHYHDDVAFIVLRVGQQGARQAAA